MKSEIFTMTIEGFSGLIFNSNVELLAFEPVDKGPNKDLYEREHYRERAYATDTGALYIPAIAVRETMIEACRFYPKKPKGTLFKSFGPLVGAALVFADHAMLIGKTLDDLYPYRSVVNLIPSRGKRGPRGARTRPMLPPPWRSVVDFVVVDPVLEQTVLAEIAERAGKQCGFLDGRSQGFGRAIVTVKNTGKTI